MTKAKLTAISCEKPVRRVRRAGRRRRQDPPRRHEGRWRLTRDERKFGLAPRAAGLLNHFDHLVLGRHQHTARLRHQVPQLLMAQAARLAQEAVLLTYAPFTQLLTFETPPLDIVRPRKHGLAW